MPGTELSQELMCLTYLNVLNCLLTATQSSLYSKRVYTYCKSPL